MTDRNERLRNLARREGCLHVKIEGQIYIGPYWETWTAQLSRPSREWHGHGRTRDIAVDVALEKAEADDAGPR